MRRTHADVVGDAGRADKFSRYVQPEIPVLLRVAASMTTQTADAEDLVQDTLVRAWQSIDRFDGTYPRAWLLTILRRAEVNRNRRRRPAPAGTLIADSTQPLLLAASAPDGPEESAVAESFRAVVAAAYQQLPERQRQVIRLVDVEGLRYTEVAEALGVPMGTVESRLHRARARIRARLVEAGLVLPR